MSLESQNNLEPEEPNIMDQWIKEGKHTSKEKAMKLIWEYLPLINGWTSVDKTKQATKVALLSVNKQLELINLINNDSADDYYEGVLQIKEALESML